MLDGGVGVVLKMRGWSEEREDEGERKEGDAIGARADERLTRVEGDEDSERVEKVLGEERGRVTMETQAVEGRRALEGGRRRNEREISGGLKGAKMDLARRSPGPPKQLPQLQKFEKRAH